MIKLANPISTSWEFCIESRDCCLAPYCLAGWLTGKSHSFIPGEPVLLSAQAEAAQWKGGAS